MRADGTCDNSVVFSDFAASPHDLSCGQTSCRSTVITAKFEVKNTFKQFHPFTVRRMLCVVGRSVAVLRFRSLGASRQLGVCGLGVGLEITSSISSSL